MKLTSGQQDMSGSGMYNFWVTPLRGIQLCFPHLLPLPAGWDANVVKELEWRSWIQSWEPHMEDGRVGLSAWPLYHWTVV